MSSSDNTENGEDALNRLTMGLEPLIETGSLLVGRYSIQGRCPPTQSRCYFAVDQSTGSNVFVKFFDVRSSKCDNAVKFHEFLADGDRYICKMLDHRAAFGGQPLFLVLEKGDLTVEDLMTTRPLSRTEQKMLLYQVLEALAYLHSRGIVHGHLHPSHIVWFPEDFCWKLVNLGYAGRAEELGIRHQYSSPYDPPEMAESRARHSGHISLEHSMDMWSFGILAFEILNGCTVGNPDRVLDDVTRRWSGWPCYPMAGASQHGPLNADFCNALSAEEWLALRFVKSFYRHDPSARMTATEALNDGFFFSGNVASSLSAAYVFDLKLAIGRPNYQLIHQIASHGTERTAVQSLSDLSAAFDMLPVESRNADMCLIDIRISSGSDRPLHFFTVHEIRVASLGEEFSKLDFGQSCTGSVIHAVAGIPCSGINRLDQQLNMASDDCGRMEVHLGLWIRLEVVDSDHVPRMQDLLREVQCQLISLNNAKGRGRFRGLVKGVMKRLPQSARNLFPEKMRQP